MASRTMTAFLVGFMLVDASATSSARAEPSATSSPAPDAVTAPTLKAKPKKTRAATKPKTGQAATPKAAKAEAPKPLEPWQAVDPGRTAAGRNTQPDPTQAAMPGIEHIVRPDEDPVSVGMKWNSSNTPNPGLGSTAGVIYQNDHAMGAQSEVGTDAQVGVKLKF